jgi:hypothetical protein
MNWLTPEMVYEKIEKLVLQGKPPVLLKRDFPLKGD